MKRIKKVTSFVQIELSRKKAGRKIHQKTRTEITPSMEILLAPWLILY